MLTGISIALLIALTLTAFFALRYFQLQQHFSQVQTEKASLQGHLQALTNEEQKRKQIKDDIKYEFENLANRIFDTNGKKFTDINQALLSPLREQMSEFRKKVEAVHEKNIADRASLLTKIQELQQLNQQLSGDAQQLAVALKGDPRSRGAWGEMILQRVLEASGLQEGREYEIQFTVKKEGQLLRPDALVRLPRERDVVIDAKLSLLDYHNAVNATIAGEREKHLQAHARAIRKHIKELGGKYLNLAEIRTLDATIMFIPIESAFAEALRVDNSLQEEAFQRNIVLAGPSTLFAHLKSIHIAWGAEERERNVENVWYEVNGFLEKIVGFSNDLEKVGENLNRAQSSYDEAHKKLISGRGSVASRAEKIQKLGSLYTKKALPKVNTAANDKKVKT